MFRVAVEGESMVPGLRPGDWLVATAPRRVRRGDVVVIRPPGRDFEAVKRVVGLPGERVALSAGAVFVDGRRLREPYAGGAGLDGSWLLARHEYLVLGDRRDASTDGRAFGPIPREAIVGVVRARYWPDPGLLRRPGTTRSRRHSSPLET